MKIRVTNYTFDASAQTITFTDYNPINLDALLLITNVTDNVIIYNFADSTKGGTVATKMSDTDDLQIFYDDDVVPATDASVQALGMTVDNAIDQTAYDLNSSAFSATTSVSELNFSTAEEKTVTVTSSDGTVLYADTNTNQSLSLVDIDTAYNGGENITVDVTQFTSAGTMDCVLKVKQGGAGLSGNPVLGAGSNLIGEVTPVAGADTDFPVSVANGNVPGFSFVLLTGENYTIGTATETIRSSGGRYPFPTSAATFTIESDNANDTAAGTGAQTVFVTLLDANRDVFTETVTLNGTTPVNFAAPGYRINAAAVATVGSGGANAGKITIKNGVDNLGDIEASEGFMRQMVYSVPNNHTMTLVDFVTTTGKTDEATVESRAYINGVESVFSKILLYESTVDISLYGKVPLGDTTDIETTAFDTGGAVSGVTLFTQWILRDLTV
jgi:hypothetical protein